MPEVKPFAAVRYDFSRFNRDLSCVIAPPYDVLNQADKDTLLNKDPHNIVAVDLPHVPPKSAGPAEVYQKAAKQLESWMSDGTLITEPRPAIYVYHQLFQHEGQSYTRRMFIACVRLQPFSEGSILPHEQTFGGPKEDRLALMKASRTQLSPILGMYTDPQDRIGKAFEAVVAGQPSAVASLDQVDNQCWVVTDRGIIDTVVSAMADKKVYIADGHHRYGTALLYRDWLTQQQGGSLPPDHRANYIMFVLASMDDPGCLILPYNRAVANVDVATLVDAWAEGTKPASNGHADIRLYDGQSGGVTPLQFTNRDVLKSLEPDQCPSWSKLDYAYLHRYLLDELLTKKLGCAPDVRYVKSAAVAQQTAKENAGVALLVNATPMAHLRAVSEEGGLMPQKSTYFYPKLATGIALNPLE